MDLGKHLVTCCPEESESVEIPPPLPRYRPGAIYGSGVMQRLLLRPEYSALEDIVLVEGSFVELGSWAQGMRFVHLALTSDHVIMAERAVLTAAEEDDDDDDEYEEALELSGMAMLWAAPLTAVSLDCLPGKFVLKLQPGNKPYRYFELCSQPYRYRVWGDWCERVDHRFKSPRAGSYKGKRADRLQNYFGDRRLGHRLQQDGIMEVSEKQSEPEEPARAGEEKEVIDVEKEHKPSLMKRFRIFRRRILKQFLGKDMQG